MIDQRAASAPEKAGHSMLITVLGPVAAEEVGVTDAHGHVWIERVAGVAGTSPVLDNWDASRGELLAFQAAGGSMLVDCQPGFCGRNGRVLASLAQETSVHLVACTGFHLRKYYPMNSPVWDWNASQAAAHFLSELSHGLAETRDQQQPVRAGFIKVACEATLRESARKLLEAAAVASQHSGAAVEIHTEKGMDAEAILKFFLNHGVPADRLVLCHIDKRADVSLHQDLAAAGALLEYDTFFRPKYSPEQTTWPLLERMLADGRATSIALAADFAEPENWGSQGGAPGLAGWMTMLEQRLRAMGASPYERQRLFGKNIAERLAQDCRSC